MELLLFILIFIFLLIVVIAITDTIEKCSYYKWKAKSNREFLDKESEDKNAKTE
nr:MAG TPA: hypothetical protein [Caudoviricetes sp.]